LMLDDNPSQQSGRDQPPDDEQLVPIPVLKIDEIKHAEDRDVTD